MDYLLLGRDPSRNQFQNELQAAIDHLEKIGLDELELIREYAAVFGKGTNYHYCIFSKGGFTDGLLQAQERGEVQLLTLADIFE